MMKQNYLLQKENNKGVALITAMMIVAITGIISTNLLWDNIPVSYTHLRAHET